MENRAKKLLFDVLVSGRSIRDWCDSRTFTDYERDRQFRRAVEREFEIIGEALNRLAQADPTTTARIQDLARIVGFRNRIVHGYDAVDDAAVGASSRAIFRGSSHRWKPCCGKPERAYETGDRQGR